MIPLALLFSVSVLYLQGKSANLLSIGAVDFGIIVDSSVIIVENVFRHITAKNADRTRPLIDRIIEASYEIERALFFSTLIIVCAFIPLFSMTGPEGALFGPMANTYAFAICGALLLAVTLTPVLCSFLFHNKKEEKETFVDRIMKLRYLVMLDRVLNHRYLLLAAMGGLLAFTITLIPKLGGEFMPPLEEGNLWIRAILPRTVTLQEAARMAPRLREVIGSIPEIKGVMSHVGRPDDGTDITSFFNLEFNAPLTPMEQWREKPIMFLGHQIWTRKITREEIQDELMEKFKEFPSVNFNFSQLIRDNVEEALSGVKGANSIKLFGNDLDVLEQAGQRVINILNTGAGHLQRGALPHRRPAQPRDPDRPPRVRPLRDQRVGRRGGRAGRRRRPGVHPDGRGREALRHRAPTAQRPARRSRGHRPDPGRHARPGRQAGGPDPSAAAGPHRPPQTGRRLHLSREQSPLHPDQVQRQGSRPGLDHRRSPGARSRIPSTARSFPPGYDIDWSGEFQQMEEANDRLMWIVPISIGLILSLLYTAFNSIKDALLVMVNVVEASMGGVWRSG